MGWDGGERSDTFVYMSVNLDGGYELQYKDEGRSDPISKLVTRVLNGQRCRTYCMRKIFVGRSFHCGPNSCSRPNNVAVLRNIKFLKLCNLK